MQVGSLFVALGFQVDDKKLKEFNDGIKNVTLSIAKLTAGAAAGIYAVNRFISESVGNAQKLQKFNMETGFATEGLERFYNVARSLDQTVTFDQVISGFQKMSEIVGSAAWGEFSGKALFAGIYDPANSSPEEIISTIRANRDKILYGQLNGNRSAFKKLLDEVGLGDFMGAIMADEETYKRLYESALPTSPEQLEALLRMSKAMSDFKYNFSVFKREMSVKIEPYWVKMLENAIPILTEFTDNMIFLGHAAMEAFAGFSPEMQTGIIGFLAVLFARLNPVTSAVLSLVWALNELSKFMQGEDSVFSKLGDIVDKGTLKALQMMESDDTSLLGGMKRYLSDKVHGEGALSDEQLNIRNPSSYYHNTKKDLYPPQPYPIQNGDLTIQNNMQIYSDSADGLEIGRGVMDRASQSAINVMRSKTGSVVYGGQ